MKDTVALLERSVNQTRRVLASVPEARRHAATPCPDWDVSALVQHVIAQDLHNFVVAARGDMVDWQAPADQLDGEWISAFDARATLVLETWRAADLDREVTGPGDLKAALRGRADQQIAELAIHSWDLVQATSQDTPLDDELAEHALA